MKLACWTLVHGMWHRLNHPTFALVIGQHRGPGLCGNGSDNIQHWQSLGDDGGPQRLHSSSSCHLSHLCCITCFQCFDAVGWAAGRASGLQKTEWWGAGVVICLERGADLHIAQLMPLPLTVSCFNKIQIGLPFLVPALLGSPGKRAVKQVCVCVYVALLDMYLLLLFNNTC